MDDITHVRTAFAAAAGYVGQNPEKAVSWDVPATASMDGGLRAKVVHDATGVVVTSDMAKAVGGGGAAPSPGWLFRASLAVCDATMMAIAAARQGVRLDRLEVTVDTLSDDRGLLGVDDSVSAGPLQARVTVTLGAAGVDEDELRDFVTWAEAHSPVGDALRRAVPVETVVNVVGASPPGDDEA